jgi:transketolase
VSCAYSNANVKIYGGHAGITVGEDGATHQALEDIAIMRVLPRMTVIVPADATEMRKATLAAAKMQGPVYLRGGRVKLPQVTKADDSFVIGKANLLREGKDVTIIACGIMVREAILAAEELAKQGIDAAVLNLHTIKPLDENAIIAAAHETGAIVTAEEHQIIGGMGSAVCEILSDHYPVPVERVGVRDTFCESGTADALLDKYGLRAKDIVVATLRVLEQKKAGNQAGNRAAPPKAVPALEPAAVKTVIVKTPKASKAAAKAPAKAQPKAAVKVGAVKTGVVKAGARTGAKTAQAKLAQTRNAMKKASKKA